MKKFSKIICLVLAIAVVFTAVAAIAVVMLRKDAPDNNGGDGVRATRRHRSARSYTSPRQTPSLPLRVRSYTTTTPQRI